MKKTAVPILILLLSVVFAFFGCRKSDASTAKNISAQVDSIATCGFLLKINASGTIYNAINLPEHYQKDSLKIVLSYHLLDTKFYCLTSPPNGYPEIYIDAIHKE